MHRSLGVVHRFVRPEQLLLKQNDISGKRESEVRIQFLDDPGPHRIEVMLSACCGPRIVLAGNPVTVREMRCRSVPTEHIVNDWKLLFYPCNEAVLDCGRGCVQCVIQVYTDFLSVGDDEECVASYRGTDCDFNSGANLYRLMLLDFKNRETHLPKGRREI